MISIKLQNRFFYMCVVCTFKIPYSVQMNYNRLISVNEYNDYFQNKM